MWLRGACVCSVTAYFDLCACCVGVHVCTCVCGWVSAFAGLWFAFCGFSWSAHNVLYPCLSCRNWVRLRSFELSTSVVVSQKRRQWGDWFHPQLEQITEFLLFINIDNLLWHLNVKLINIYVAALFELVVFLIEFYSRPFELSLIRNTNQLRVLKVVFMISSHFEKKVNRNLPLVSSSS